VFRTPLYRRRVATLPDRYILLLGSNVEREENLDRAVQILESRFPVLARSRVVESDAVGDPTGPPFHNRALIVRSDLPPREMRSALHAIEHSLGRLRTMDRNAPRTIDIDVLCVLDAAGALLPGPPLHKDLLRHHYATVPAAEIAGDLVLHDGTTLAAAALAMGPPPKGFRVLPA
jgi:2-amino-4-hydroxy-6-hydroxymethyldihydropteridine diphosphokinase